MRTWNLALPLDPSAKLPLFLQIADQVKVAIREDRLRPGEALPGSRTLADQLGVNRNTVVAAFQELEAEGWITTRQAGGTFVALTPPRGLGRLATASLTPPGVLPFEVHEPPAQDPSQSLSARLLSCWTGQVDPRVLPMVAFARAYRKAAGGADPSALRSENPQGYEPLRVALADMLRSTRGVPARPETLLVTTGMREALSLVCRALLRPGDRVAVEALGRKALWSALKAAGAELCSVSVDSEGLDVGALVPLAPRLVALAPSLHYPTLVTLSPGRERHLLDLALKQRMAILELDEDPGFQYSGAPVLSLASRDTLGSVVHIGSMGRVLFPTLPMAYIHGAPALIRELVRWRKASSQSNDPFLERAFTELLTQGELQRHLDRLWKVCAERREALAASLERRLGQTLQVRRPRAGLAYWLQVTQAGVDVAAWAGRARQWGMAFRPGQDFALDGQPMPWLRMGFGALEPAELDEAVIRMSRALPERRR